MKVALIGLPNVGKTSIFNELTKTSNKTGNWAGTTVGNKLGLMRYLGKFITVVDFPGINDLYIDNLQPQTLELEHNTIDNIINEQYDLIINVVDVGNIESSLPLTIDLLNLKIPTIVVLNMVDTLHNMSLDYHTLEILLGTKVIAVSSKKKTGLTELKNLLVSNFTFIPDPKILLGHGLDKQLNKLSTKKDIFDFFHHLKTHNNNVYYKSKLSLIRNIYQKVIRHKETQTITDILDTILLHKFWGLISFIIILYLLFSITLTVGSFFQDYVDAMANIIFVQGSHYLLTTLHASDFIILLISNSVGGAIQVVLSFAPILFCFFILTNILEQSGYITRIIFLADKIMGYFGLSGKSIIPMILSFGCTVPSVMSAKIIDNPQQRQITILISHFISCSARFVVYILFINAFFKNHGSLVLVSIYLGGMILALIVAFIFKNFLKIEKEKFTVIQIPRYQMPSLRQLIKNANLRLNFFFKKATKLIIPIIVILTLLNNLSLDKHNNNDTILASIAQYITPIFTPMGINANNWPATVGIITGFLAKEAVIGSMQALYQTDHYNDDHLITLNTITNNIVTLHKNILQQLHIIQSSPSSNNDYLANQEDPILITHLQHNFQSKSSIIAFLIFFMIYTPCISVLATIKAERNKEWMIISFITTTWLGYWLAIIFYQTVNFMTHPINSTIFIILGLFFLSLFFYQMKYYLKKISLNCKY